MLIREHRGSLQESLATSEKIGNNVLDVQRYIFDKLFSLRPAEFKVPTDLHITFGPLEVDSRCHGDWMLHSMVHITGYGVFGYVNERVLATPVPDTMIEVGMYSGVDMSRYCVDWHNGPIPEGVRLFALKSDLRK